jgi:Right handed beta helix region
VMNANTLVTNTGADHDLGQAISDYFASCSHSCTVYIPSGTYSYATTITIPGVTAGSFRLIGEKGTVLSYTGSSDAIVASVSLPSGDSNLQISGFQLSGTSAASSGIHLRPSNVVTVSEMQITGFSSGSGIFVEGLNGSSLQNNAIFSNLYGILLQPTFCTGSSCSPTGSGPSTYSPNAIHIHDNYIQGNVQWGIYFYAPEPHGLALNNIISSNVLEQNGNASGQDYGDIYIERGQGTVIEDNYFETSLRHIVLGALGAGTGYVSTGDHITGNYFTSGSAPYNIELDNSKWTVIDGNNDLYGTSKICEIETPAAGDEYGTIVGLNGFTTGNYLTCVGGLTGAYLPGTNSFTQPVIQTATFAGCSITPGSVGTTCNATGYWSAPLSTLPNNVVCQIAAAGTGANTLGALTGLSTTGVAVQEIAVSASAAGGGVIYCVSQWSSN